MVSTHAAWRRQMLCWACCRPRKASVSPIQQVHTIHVLQIPDSPHSKDSGPLLENGFLRHSLVSRSESSLLSADTGPRVDLARSTPSLVLPSEDMAPVPVHPVQSRASSPHSSSLASSIASVNQADGPGGQHQENSSEEEGGPVHTIEEELEDRKEDLIEAEDKPIEVALSPIKEPSFPNVSFTNGLEEENDSRQKSPIPSQQDENENPIDTPTPDTKSLSTPASSEFGSESSKNTETSGNTIEGNTNGAERDKPKRRIPRAIEPLSQAAPIRIALQQGRQMVKKEGPLSLQGISNAEYQHMQLFRAILKKPQNLQQQERICQHIRWVHQLVKKDKEHESDGVGNSSIKNFLKTKPKVPSKEKPPLFPSTLMPFENPKDAMLKTLLQLENPQWEVVMQGLQCLVRLCRHHSKFLATTTHSVATTLVNNIKNLRSQVSRGSCQATKELFDVAGRFLDSEVEDLAVALLSRTADTNKFLRGDALAALDSLVDHSSPMRSIGILVNKGAKHQNGLVRCATARLLLRVTKKLGADRALSLPRDSRDILIVTSAKLLTEGSLETRRYAKEIFQALSSDSRFNSVLSEVVPHNQMRNISKVLSKIAIPTKK